MASACSTAARIHFESADWFTIRLFDQPSEAAEPQPRKRSFSPSSSPITTRVKLLPTSMPVASMGLFVMRLFLNQSALTHQNPVVQPQIEDGSVRILSHLPVMVHEVQIAGPKMLIAQPQFHRVAVDCRHYAHVFDGSRIN